MNESVNVAHRHICVMSGIYSNTCFGNLNVGLFCTIYFQVAENLINFRCSNKYCYYSSLGKNPYYHQDNCVPASPGH